LRPLAALAGACVVGLACVSVRYSEGSPVQAERIPEIVIGQTTRSDILGWFGAPETFTDTNVITELVEDLGLSPQEALALPFSDTMVFRFTKGRMKATVLGFYNSFDVRVTADTLVVFFDEQDKVSSYGYRKGNEAAEE
jgi:hypothetical protein